MGCSFSFEIIIYKRGIAIANKKEEEWAKLTSLDPIIFHEEKSSRGSLQQQIINCFDHSIDRVVKTNYGYSNYGCSNSTEIKFNQCVTIPENYKKYDNLFCFVNFDKVKYSLNVKNKLLIYYENQLIIEITTPTNNKYIKNMFEYIYVLKSLKKSAAKADALINKINNKN